MEFRKVLALRGPNIWANSPVIEAWVDLKHLKDTASNSVAGFNDRLMSWLPTMIEHECSEGHRGGFFERLREGTYPAHILEHVTLELQCLAGMPVGYGRARETSEEGVYKVVFKYKDETLARACLETARRLILAALGDQPFDIAAEVQKLRELKSDVCLGPSTSAIVEAARARGIPFHRLNTESLVMFGQGARQRRIIATETDRTGAVAESIAQDKDLTRSLLRAAGVPVPKGRPVNDVEHAVETALDLGFPVVVKPQFGNHGRGVATNLNTADQVRAAYELARAEDDHVVVERFAPGADHRLLVIGDKLVAASRREPAHVIGDGRSTILQLINAVNRDPRRGDGHASVLTKIQIDGVALGVLSEQGFVPESVPDAGRRVLIRRNANLSTGGTATDVTDMVHPDVAARAVDAAKIVGLDIAGIDVVAADIGRPLEEQGGIVVEVNASPGLRMHLEPSAGTPRPAGEAIIDLMFPAGETGRIPIVAITGTNGKTTTTRLIAHILRKTTRNVGMTCTDGIYLDSRLIEAGDCSGPRSARSLLMNPRVEAAVFETARGGILREGLGFDRCSVAVVTNLGEGDHLGLNDIQTLEKMALVKRTIVDVVLPEGAAVLNAADLLVAGMAPHCRGSVVYFARDPRNPVIEAHRQAGGRAVFVRNEAIVLAEGPNEQALVALTRVPMTRCGSIPFQIENAIAAAAAAWSLNIPETAIRSGLETFAADSRQAPGRFNVLEANGATVVVDYGHNPSALEALVEAIGQFPGDYRTAVFTAEGDRRDQDIIRQAEILSHAFDAVYLYEYKDLRGRNPGEIPALLRRGLERGQRVAEVVDVRSDQAIEVALRSLRPGDLVLIQADVLEIEETLAVVQRHLTELPDRSPRHAVDAEVDELIPVGHAADSLDAANAVVHA